MPASAHRRAVFWDRRVRWRPAKARHLPLGRKRLTTYVIPIARKLGRADAGDHDVDALLAAELVGRDHRTVTVPPLSVAASVRLG